MTRCGVRCFFQYNRLRRPGKDESQLLFLVDMCNSYSAQRINPIEEYALPLIVTFIHVRSAHGISTRGSDLYGLLCCEVQCMSFGYFMLPNISQRLPFVNANLQ